MEEGGKSRVPKKLLLFAATSLLLNALFVCYFFVQPDGGRSEFGWFRWAAEEAEAVAAISCSGHGRAYVDGVPSDGRPVCECNTCYAGVDCSVPVPDCPADADSGDPLYLEPYWRRNVAAGAVVVSPWHRMSYQANGNYFISLELERHIRLLHDAVGNAVTRDRSVVFGAGSTQLINSAVHALSLDSGSNASSFIPSLVVATPPYYALYKRQTLLLDSSEYRWEGSTANWVNLSAPPGAKFIEFVTSPNNPDGRLKQSVLGSSLVINDHAYYWPLYSAIPAPADEDLMIFTDSKVSGHAGSRFGWALVKDEKVYQKMIQYMQVNTMGASRDTQLRVLKLLKVILAKVGTEGDIFKYGYEMLSERWRMLNNIISSSKRFSLQNLSPQYCTYFQRIRDPSPAYAWLKCEQEEDADCEAVLREAGIISRSGKVFEAEGYYTRLSLLKTQDDFNQLLMKMEALVSKEKLLSLLVDERVFR
ncbi:hypothetical protein HPP92_011479 [Vanilla planifolia]|uniref:Alliin lyase n=1 Tax=Vanilla planifolia TaxID=51239 RepID=A0A835QVS3_VANPL|nr:hypothetical protein HPP92_011479 [Vanilla planifolia]